MYTLLGGGEIGHVNERARCAVPGRPRIGDIHGAGRQLAKRGQCCTGCLAIARARDVEATGGNADDVRSLGRILCRPDGWIERRNGENGHGSENAGTRLRWGEPRNDRRGYGSTTLWGEPQVNRLASKKPGMVP